MNSRIEVQDSAAFPGGSSAGFSAKSNPFATKFIRAGALPFRFAKGESLQQFRVHLEQSNWQGQIVGPHGSGKTTLLRTLDEHWSNWGRIPIVCSLHNGQRSIGGLLSIRDLTPQHQIIVDGYEQLIGFSKIRLLASCRLRGCGLLITTHKASRWLKKIQSTSTSVQLAEDLVSELMRTTQQKHLVKQSVQKHFNQHAGNLRETFLSLYDEYAHELRG